MVGATVPLRGRDAELRLLRSRLAAAMSDGRSGIVVLTGVPGSGKSRLLQEVRMLADQVGARVLSVVGDPDDKLIPFGALLEGVQAGPVPLFDRSALDGLPPDPDRGWWLRQALLARLEEVAVHQPVVVCVDDLQWCGHGTLRLIRTLPPQLATEAVVWVVAVRSDSADPAVRATVGALQEAGAELLALPPLDDAAVALLVGDVLGAVPDDGVLASAARAGGHPLMLVELLRGWLDERLLDVDGASARLRGDVLPTRLLDAVQRRTHRLSTSAVQALQVGTVLGRRFPPDLLAAVLDRPPPAVLAPLQELLSAGLLRDDGEQLCFEHDLIREAVCASIPASFLRLIRRHTVDVLLARGAPTIQVATLLAESAQHGDLEAVAALRDAAVSLVPTAAPEAADLSLRALELLPQDSPLRIESAVQAIRHLWQCGRLDDGERLASTMLTGGSDADRSAEAQLRLELARLTTRFGEATRQCRKALALPGLSAPLRLELQLVLANNLGLAAEPDEAESVVMLVRGGAGDALDAATSAKLARAESYAAFHRHQWDRAFERQQHVARMTPLGDDGNPTALWEACLWTLTGYPNRCLSTIDAELVAMQRDSRLGPRLMFSSLRARALLEAGRLTESRAEAQAVLDRDEIHVDGALMDLFIVYALVRGALQAGWSDVVRAHWTRVQQMTVDESGLIRRNGQWLTALAAAAAEDMEAALRAAGEAVTTLGRQGPSIGGWPDLADEVVLVRMALLGGQRDTATRAVEAAEHRAALNPGYSVAAAVALQARGLLSGDEACLREAVSLLDGSERPLLLASAREDVARLVAPDRPLEAIGLLDQAHRSYGEAGAERDAARARRALRQLGVRRQRTSNVRKRREGLAGLTPTQREVVRLVADGCTNAQVATRMFVSPHTVNAHLRNAFATLGIRSRVELARLVAAQDGLGPV